MIGLILIRTRIRPVRHSLHFHDHGFDPEKSTAVDGDSHTDTAKDALLLSATLVSTQDPDECQDRIRPMSNRSHPLTPLYDMIEPAKKHRLHQQLALHDLQRCLARTSASLGR